MGGSVYIFFHKVFLYSIRSHRNVMNIFNHQLQLLTTRVTATAFKLPLQQLCTYQIKKKLAVNTKPANDCQV